VGACGPTAARAALCRRTSATSPHAAIEHHTRFAAGQRAEHVAEAQMRTLGQIAGRMIGQHRVAAGGATTGSSAGVGRAPESVPRGLPLAVRCAAVDDLLRTPVGTLAGLVRDRVVSAAELVTAALERIEAVDDRINAFVDVDGERAVADAARVRPGQQPFAGVPIAIKANVAVRDRPLHFASRFLGDNRAPVDAYLVARLRAAGFVIVGLTNLPEFGILPTTEPVRTGPTRNPWDLDRTPGGSSGGSAAAVAAGMVPIAHGNDGGGSIRIPAACCGLVGLKPSRGRISHGPGLGDNLLASDGVLTHTVADTALALDVLAGYEVGDATWAPPPDES
jgi:amidase